MEKLRILTPGRLCHFEEYPGNIVTGGNIMARRKWSWTKKQFDK